METNLKSQLKKFHYQRSEEHTSELQSRSDLVCRLLLEKKNVVGGGRIGGCGAGRGGVAYLRAVGQGRADDDHQAEYEGWVWGGCREGGAEYPRGAPRRRRV